MDNIELSLNNLEAKMMNIERKINKLIIYQEKQEKKEKWRFVWKLILFIIVFILPLYFSLAWVKKIQGNNFFNEIKNFRQVIPQ